MLFNSRIASGYLVIYRHHNPGIRGTTITDGSIISFEIPNLIRFMPGRSQSAYIDSLGKGSESVSLLFRATTNPNGDPPFF